MKFVWSEGSRFIAGAGGTENHTLGRARELKRRGLNAELIIISDTEYDTGAPDIATTFLKSINQLSTINDTIIYIARGQDVSTLLPSYIFLHFPIDQSQDSLEEVTLLRAMKRSKLITNSQFARGYWSKRLALAAESIAVVYPFSNPVFGEVKRAPQGNTIKVLYPNRIQAEKGLFIFTEAASYLSNNKKFEFIVLGAGNKTITGKANEAWLRRVPYLSYQEPYTSLNKLANAYASSDIVVIPSRDDIWQEPFGMTSIEAQSAGCRVIASDSGGLRETDCGLVDFVAAGNAVILKQAIETASSRGPATVSQRTKAKQKFTLARNVDTFLDIVNNQSL